MLVGEEAHLKLVFFPYRHQDQYIMQYAFLGLNTFHIQTDQQSPRTRPMTLHWQTLMMTLVLEVFKTSASPGGGGEGKGLMLQIDRRITSLIVLPKYTLALSVWFRYGILMLGCSLCLPFIFLFTIVNMSSRWYRWKELLMTWSKICWTSKAEVTGPLPWFNNSHKEYVSLSYWSVNADKKGWGSVVSTLLYCGIDGNPRKNYPFWYVSPLSRFLSKVRLLLFVPSLSNTWSASCSFVTIFFPYRHSTSEFPTLTF